MQSTRWGILEILKRKGQSSVDDLATALQLTPMGIRQHLMILQRDGFVEANEVRRKTGRPHYVFRLTDNADELFPRSYDTLLDMLISEIKADLGPVVLDRLLSDIATKVVAVAKQRVAGKDFESRIIETAKILEEHGSLSEWGKTNGEYFIKEFNCPYHSVAHKHPELCSVSSSIIGNLVGSGVDRTECLLNGATSCTYIIRRPE